MTTAHNPRRTTTVPADLLHEVVGFLEGVEKAAGRPLNKNADIWAGGYARRLRAYAGMAIPELSEDEKHAVIDGMIAELDAMGASPLPPHGVNQELLRNEPWRWGR